VNDEITQARKLLSDHGLKRTLARIAVLRHLLSATVPQTAAQIEDAVAEHGFNQSTIYRTLESLTEAGLISQREFGDRVWRFEMRNPENLSHPHSLCVECGRVECLDAGAVKKWTKLLPAGFVLTEVVFRGHCGECAPR